MTDWTERFTAAGIAAEKARREAAERASQWLQSTASCQCKAPVRLRMYRGQWQCGVCLKPCYGIK